MSTTQTPLEDKPQGEAHGVAEARPLFDGPIVRRAIIDSFWKLNPRSLLKNPVIFTVEVVSVLVTIRIVADVVSGGPIAFDTAIAIGLWFTVLFANFAEAMAEGRGKAQAEALRRTRADLVARRLLADGTEETVPASQLRKGDLVMISAGELIPGDGEIEEGIASVDESAITGESAPVIRESGGDRSAVTAGTKVLSDWIKVRVTAEPGESFLDRMIDLVEGAERQKTPNEIALSILLAKFTIIFLIVCV
ncbi:MAG TPA: potassium-transporting ATPase subunit B, partial [Actinomycetota bacterium]|nr:potassium-transporting ATPase subunit B [Actinomycetota bacterium]